MKDCEPSQQVKCEHRLTSIETKLDTLIDQRKSAMSKLWDTAKLFLSAAAGAVAGIWGSK